MTTAKKNCSAKPQPTVRQGNLLRLSEQSQAAATIATMPSRLKSFSSTDQKNNYGSRKTQKGNARNALRGEGSPAFGCIQYSGGTSKCPTKYEALNRERPEGRDAPHFRIDRQVIYFG